MRLPLVASLVLAAVVMAGCGSADPTLGLFESQGVIDWDSVGTLEELAALSDVIVLGTLIDVEEGYVVGSSVDDESASPEIELIINTGAVEPMRLLWSYAPGYSVDEIRRALPIGARLVVYATEFAVPASDQGSYHHIGDEDHAHWRWTNPQGLMVEDPQTGELLVYAPPAAFSDVAPAAQLDDFLAASLPFERRPELAGLCEDQIVDFVEGEPSPFTTEQEAVDRFVAENSILRGLELVDGGIYLRGRPVGGYRVISRPGDTFAVGSANWCYPG